MAADPELEAVLEKWGSEDRAQECLKEEFNEINLKAFRGRLHLPRIWIKPMWLSKGLLGEQNAGGNYEPKEGNWLATISLFTAVLLEDDLRRRVLAHEMVHHWEPTIKEETESIDYPTSIDRTIAQRFSNPSGERSWRSRHSRTFIAKACCVARALGFPPEKLLFGK